MQIISTREFRTNQGKFLTAAKNGQSIVLKSRYGNFKITPVSDEDSLVSRISQGLHEAKLIEKGELKGYSLNDLLTEL